MQEYRLLTTVMSCLQSRLPPVRSSFPLQEFSLFQGILQCASTIAPFQINTECASHNAYCANIWCYERKESGAVKENCIIEGLVLP